VRLAPVAAGLAAAAIAFAAVATATDGDGGGERTAAASPAGRDVFLRMGCGGCHGLAAAGSHGEIGPDLDAALSNHTRDSLVAKISQPGAMSMMPNDFASRMSDAELSALVDFLLASR
jgi:mono/diheme cytochrome c family protein